VLYEPAEESVAPTGEKALYVLYDFERTQNTRSYKTTLQYLMSFACNSSVSGARTLKTEIACNAVGGSTRSGKILSEIYLHF